MLYLSDNEIANLCAPLTQPAAQVRYLRTLGLSVALRPNGRPVVIRCHAEAVLSGGAAVKTIGTVEQPKENSRQQPSREALISLLQGGQDHGTSKSAQPIESSATRLR